MYNTNNWEFFNTKRIKLSTIKQLSIFVSLTFLLVSNCMAYTLEEAVRSGLIDAGVFLFVGGASILIIHRLTKLGIIFMLLGDLVVLSRIFFSYDIINYLDKCGYNEYFIGIDQVKFRIILACILLLIMILLGLLGALKNWIWRSFWRLFGFYKSAEQKDKSIKEKKVKNKITKVENNKK